MTPFEVKRKVAIADDVHLFELVPVDSAPLPAFEAGAHITLLTPNGMTRRYTLCNAPAERDRYLIAVKRDAQGLGGSTSLVDDVAVGDRLQVSAPRNDFALDAQAGSHLLIAGGIGVTPILAMARALQARGAEFRVVYITRSASASAFLDQFKAPDFAARVFIHHDHGDRARAYDLAPLLAEWPPGAHLYCCGPRPLMRAVREHARHWPPGSVHFEDFGSVEDAGASIARGFAVRLLRSGVTLDVPHDQSILQAVRGHGIAVPSSCESGTCGSCRTGLVSGRAQHRDFVLDEDEHDQAIMICVSRAESPLIELDL